MNRIKVEKSKDYTVISNVFLKDKNLSLKAKGLFAMVMSLKEDWDFTIEGFAKIVKEGETAIYNAIKELKEFGYCSVVQLRDDKHIIGNEYTFFETPQKAQETQKLQPQEQDLGFQDVDNQGQLNTTNNIVTNKVTKRIKENSKKDELFEECWIAYRRKGSKKKALEQWHKLKDDEKELSMPHIKAYVGSREIQYQKDFERYLRDKTFQEIVFSKNKVIYDPTKKNDEHSLYTPLTDGAIKWNDYYNTYIYIGMFYGSVADGYNDDNRPNGAKIMLGNGGGFIVWNSETKTWDKVQN